jgi:CBS domain-containing protein
MNASDVMVSAVITVGPDQTVQEAAKVMLANRISGLPVVDNLANPVGMISEGDLLRRAPEGTWPKAWGPPPRRGWAKPLMGPEEPDAEYVTQHGRRVGDVMTREVVSAAPATSISRIAALMMQHRIKRIPIIQDGRVVGIVSRANIVEALAGSGMEKFAREAPHGL